MDETPLIRYKGVEIDQQALCVLHDVDFELHKGEFVYIIGKVGSGKSTLLKTIYGETGHCEMRATVLGYDMKKLSKRTFPNCGVNWVSCSKTSSYLSTGSVHDNLEFVLRATGWRQRQAIENRIAEVLERVGMENKGYKMPNELSGGEQQRIVIARAILNSPDIILADEPTGNLDVETGRNIVELLKEIAIKARLSL